MSRQFMEGVFDTSSCRCRWYVSRTSATCTTRYLTSHVTLIILKMVHSSSHQLFSSYFARMALNCFDSFWHCINLCPKASETWCWICFVANTAIIWLFMYWSTVMSVDITPLESVMSYILGFVCMWNYNDKATFLSMCVGRGMPPYIFFVSFC